VQERQGRLACRARGQLALEVGGAPAPPERIFLGRLAERKRFALREHVRE